VNVYKRKIPGNGRQLSLISIPGKRIEELLEDLEIRDLGREYN